MEFYFPRARIALDAYFFYFWKLAENLQHFLRALDIVWVNLKDTQMLKVLDRIYNHDFVVVQVQGLQQGQLFDSPKDLSDLGAYVIS